MFNVITPPSGTDPDVLYVRENASAPVFAIEKITTTNAKNQPTVSLIATALDSQFDPILNPATGIKEDITTTRVFTTEELSKPDFVLKDCIDSLIHSIISRKHQELLNKQELLSLEGWTGW